jgi:hypothetical protein
MNDSQAFLHELRLLSPTLHELGAILLTEVRKFSNGKLRYHEKSKKYVERPVNFWTVQIQPRKSCLKFTVRGVAERLPKPEGILVRDDRPSYSSFKISRKGQIPGALRIIREAQRNATVLGSWG